MTTFETNVWKHMQERNMDALKELVNKADLLDVIHVMNQSLPRERAVIFRLLGKARAVDVFEQLDADIQKQILASLSEKDTVVIFAEMEPDDRVRLLDELPAGVANKLLESLSPEERSKTADIFGYLPETAGRVMTPNYVRLKPEMTIEQALQKVRTVGEDMETVYTLYVTDEGRHLIGVLSLRELVMASPEQLVKGIMQTHVTKVSTHTDQEEVAELLREADLLAVPVVDKENRLVGIITVDDAMDILVDEASEDIYEKSGLAILSSQESARSGRLISGSLPQVWRARVPFLVITLVGGFMAGFVIDVFEETLQAVTALAIFIPVIMDMGGNVGTQSSTIFTRALILGQINMQRFSKHLLREVMVGLSMGLIIGSAAGFIAYAWQGIPQLGLVIALSLVFTMTLATLLGFLIPYLLHKVGLDQAAGADPIVTTIKDISGLTIYFLLVQTFLGFLL